MKFAEVRVRNLVARLQRPRHCVGCRERSPPPPPPPLGARTEKISPSAIGPTLRRSPTSPNTSPPSSAGPARRIPTALYLINDYGVENESKGIRASDGTEVTAAFQRARYIALANHLRETGHAPDALGLQSHTGWVQKPQRTDRCLRSIRRSRLDGAHHRILGAHHKTCAPSTPTCRKPNFRNFSRGGGWGGGANMWAKI